MFALGLSRAWNLHTVKHVLWAAVVGTQTRTGTHTRARCTKSHLIFIKGDKKIKAFTPMKGRKRAYVQVSEIIRT